MVTVAGPAVRQEHVTGVDGAYTAAGLAAGDHVITAVLPGFETAEAPVSVRAGATASVPITLQIARLLETVSVVADEPRIFARNVVAEPRLLQQSNIASVTSVVDNLPGVSIQEGDAYGFDDWSSNVAVRGFQVTITEAQIGTTIDGFPNGTSDYFSGAKANRFIDPMNLGGVEVSQGTADIASRSVEALGGTFNYLTDDPAAERTYTASTTIGENDGKRFYMRVDTGPLFGGETRAWISGRCCTNRHGPHDAHRQDPHLPIRYDTGRPSSVIRLRISQPRTTSLPCPVGLRARRPSPMMDLYRKNVFSTRL